MSIGVTQTNIPNHLYKVIPHQCWQQSQNKKFVILPNNEATCIDFTLKDHAKTILEGCRADGQQFVRLKVDSKKLDGRLVYDPNSQSSDYPFHLYDGKLPFNSIVEAKIVYLQAPTSSELPTLDIVQVGDPVLRQCARPLSTEEILSPEIQNLINQMRTTMKNAPGVGLAAPQIGRSIQLAVIEDVDHSHLTPQQIKERHRYSVPFQVIINPQVFIEQDSKPVQFFEGCLSISNLVGVVERPDSIRVECLNEQAEPVVIHARGWHARILLHEIGHLNGKLFIDLANPMTLTSAENYNELWKEKSTQEVLEYMHASKNYR